MPAMNDALPWYTARAAGLVELGQGYLFARPMREHLVGEYLAAHGSRLERAG
jgi:EAL domain-containing protein (putative c-di-GMP-specific phosphodiesterase class I)